MYFIFFIHSSMDGNLGCLHVPAIVNNTAVNTGMYVPFRTMYFSRYMPRSALFLVFLLCGDFVGGDCLSSVCVLAILCGLQDLSNSFPAKN